MNDQDPVPFKDLLRRHRLEAELSQEALAERARLSVRAISDLERGLKLWPRQETLRLLSQALGLQPQEHTALVAAARRPSGPRAPYSSEQHTGPPPTP
ncbi:MAG: helix-turn-helix transcriptional regulator, partial [Chloroflexota bacterium]